MFEGLVRQLILGYLGKYIKDIQNEQLKITLWNEEVLLENVELILEAFDYLRLPFTFKEGRIGKLSIKIPWKKLGWDPFIIILEDVYVCVSQRDDKEWCLDAVERREFASKKAQLAAAELAKLSRRVCDNQTGKSFVSYITAKILDSIQLSIRNVHILYRDTQSAKEELLFGLKFSSLVIARSSVAKVRGGQVNKLIEVQNLELYCDILEKVNDSSMKTVQRENNVESEIREDDQHTSLLAPLNVSVFLSVNRSGHLLNDAPQYTIKVDLACVVISIDKVQLQNILSLCDYMSICQLREKYGRFRPWWSPVGARLKGWHKAWWHYAQESVLSDVRRRLRKTSWKYFGDRLNSCRKYVNLYKVKLKCLRQDQVIEDNVQCELEKMEKETDVDDILSYRSVAEHELEDFLLNTSSRYGRNGGNIDKLVEDQHPPSKRRGWLNWLSYGMLGAGGTDDSNQFSGVVSDDVIEDIYEATKFHPAPALTGEVAASDDVYVYSLIINISEIHAALRSMKVGWAIADLLLKEICIEGRAREKSAIISTSVNSLQLLNSFSNQIILQTKKVSSESNVLAQQQPSLSIKVDLSPMSCNLGSSVKVNLSPTEMFCDLEFLRNMLDFFHILQEMTFQQQRIMLALNGIDDIDARLISKIDYVLSSHKKIIWDINLLNFVIYIPLENTDTQAYTMVLEASAISFTSKSETDSSCSHSGDGFHLLGRHGGFGSAGNKKIGFQFQDLYDHFEIRTDDTQIKLMMPSTTILISEKCSTITNLALCILPNEPVLQEFEVYILVPSLLVHFSALVYRKILGLISQINILLPLSESKDPSKLKSNGLASMHSWFSINADIGEIHLLLNLEDRSVDGYTLNLHCQKLGIWFDQCDFPFCRASVQACHIIASSNTDDQINHILCSTGSMWCAEPVSQHNKGFSLEGQKVPLSNEHLVVDGCIIVHFEVLRSIQWFIQKCTIHTSDLDIHFHPFIVGQFIEFLDRISVCGTSDNVKRNLDVKDENSPSCDSTTEEYGFFNERGSYEKTSMPPDFFNFIRFDNLRSFADLENLADDVSHRFGETHHLSDQKMRPSKFSPMRLRNCNTDPDFSAQTLSPSELLLVNLNFSSIKVHFHDSSCIVGTVVVPLAKSLLSISAGFLDMVCLTEGLVFSSSWWSQMINNFLWGPLSSKHSAILNLYLKNRSANKQNSVLDMTFDIQQVSATLPPDFLPMIIGYFSLPDWTTSVQEQPSDGMSVNDTGSITYNFKIADSNFITPANSDCSEFLQLNIKQLSIAFFLNIDKCSVSKDIPSACCIDAANFSDRNDCLDFFGRDLSLSLLLLDSDIFNTNHSYQNYIFITSLSVDLWVRIPCDFESNESQSPTCTMALVNDCQLHAEELRIIDVLKGLGYVINMFSAVDEESKLFTSDVLHFLQSRKQMMENGFHPETENVIQNELRICVTSSSLRLHHVKGDSTCSELMAEAEMRFVCTLSLINDRIRSFDISFSSLSLFSLLSSVLLCQFSCPGSCSSVLDVTVSVSDFGRNHITVSFYCLNLWLYLFDWNEITNLLSQLSTHLSVLASEESKAGMSGITFDHGKYVAGDNQTQVAALNISQDAGFSTLTFQHIGLNLHFPALHVQDAYKAFGGAHFQDEQPLDEQYGSPTCNQNCFLSVRLQIRNSELVTDGKTGKLSISSENLNGVLKVFSGCTTTTWPLFQSSKIFFEADVFKHESDDVHIKLSVHCDSMDLSFSSHILYFFHITWFARSEEMHSQLNLRRLDFKVHLRKFSLLLTDWKTSNGPLLEFLVRNSILSSTIMENEIEASAASDLQVNYYSIDKVLWEPFVEPWKFQLSMNRKQDESALFSGSVMTDIILESKAHLNLNINESIIEVISMTTEMIMDAWSLAEQIESPALFTNQITGSPEARRYAPYMLQNLTTLPLVFCVCQQLGADDLNVFPSKGVLQPGSSTLIYINESPEELLFRYRPMQSSDKLNDKQLLEAAHRYVNFQLEGTSAPSTPISMDLVGRRFFEVVFSKSPTVSGVYNDEKSSKRSGKGETEVGADIDRRFATPVVIDVSVQRFTKLIRLYSTVVILNATSVSLELRFDIPFGVAPKIYGPVYPGQEFPLPLHLAEVGYFRWRPVGDSYLWSEIYRISSIISQDARIGFMRSFVCYPSHPSNDAFRCCISLNYQCLPSIGPSNQMCILSDAGNDNQLENLHGLSKDLDMQKTQFLYQMVLSSPVVLKNYLMKAICITLEYAGATRTAFLSEVETSFYNIDCSHDLSITFQIHGFRPSTLKYPRAELFSKKAKFSGTKFSLPETVRFDPESSEGPLYVTMEKVMDAMSGAREIFISVPFLLYNCTGFPLVLSNTVSGMRRYSWIIPSCYNMEKQNILNERKDGLCLVFPYQNVTAPGLISETNADSSDYFETSLREVTACLFSPDPDTCSGEAFVKLSRYLPSVVENFNKRTWSAPFSLVPPTGLTSVLVPQPSVGSGYVLSVSAMAAPFSGRTKIVTFQPRYVIANACTKNLCYKQKGTNYPFLLGARQHSYVQWKDTTRDLLLSVRFDGPGWEWSGCFSSEQLGDSQIKVSNYMTASVSMMRVEVRSADVSIDGEKIVGSTSGSSGTRLILLSEDDTGFMPYRVDNHSRERLRIYQPKCESFETVIHPYTSSSYAWDEPCFPHRLIVEVPGERNLGSYAIDDTSTHSLVHLPSTSEKPERNLIICVHSEGAIKVLSVIDSSWHVLNDLKSLHVAKLKDKGKQTQKYESFVNYKERISIGIPFLGISLMNSHREELLFACAKNMQFNFVQSLDQQLFSLQIGSLQVDNQLHTTLYPVILSFKHGAKGNVANQMKYLDNTRKLVNENMSQITSSNLHDPVFSLSVAKWRNTDVSLVSFEYISLRVTEFYLEIEQEIVLRLFEFCKTASSRLNSIVFQHMDSTLNMLFSESTGETSRNSQSFAWLDERDPNSIGTSPLYEDYKRRLLPHMVPIGAPWQEIQLDTHKEKKIYVELFDIEPIKLTLSFSSSPWILRGGVLTSGESLVHRGFMALADVEGAQIHFKQLVFSHQMASWESIQEIIVSHYTRQFLHEMYKVFGSAGVIGNPVGFARSLGLGIKDFFSLPIWNVFQSPAGLVTGMAQGTTSLLSNTVYAITDATSQFSKAAHKGIVAFTFDNPVSTMAERQHKGISSQSKGVINEFLEGLTGVLQSPIKGAEKHGLPGLLSGIALGVTGLVARPAASLLEVTGKTAQSIKNRSRLRQMGYSYYRVRLPRPLSAESLLKPYSWEEAVGTYVLAETDTKLRDETLVMCKALERSGEYALITHRLILVVSCSDLVDLGKPDFRGVPVDLKWMMQSIIGLDGVILADSDGKVVHIVGSGSETLLRQILKQQKSGEEKKSGITSPLPLVQTSIGFRCAEEADEFLRVVMCMVERGRETGWGSQHILHRSNIK